MDDYIETNESADVICSLEMLYFALKKAKNNSCHWKWVILALHSAFQGAMVCNLSGTANLGALRKNHIKEFLDWYDGDRKKPPPSAQLAPAGELFKRFSGKKKRIESTMAEEITVNKKHEEAFWLLHKLRNMYSHFQPKSWFVEIEGLPNIILQILELIEEISNDSWSFRHTNKENFQNIIMKIRAEI